MTRRDVTFPSGGGRCAAWLYLPEDATTPPPVVVMGHGLGAVKEMRLDAFAERFCGAGYACLVFDYRHFGGSTGEPRQLLDIERQNADWHSALTYARSLPEVDGDRVVVWGSSFGGGHAIRVAAEDQRVAAAIAQCPFTDGLASLRAADARALARVVPRALADAAGALLGRPPVLVATAGPPHSAALMTAPDCESGYLGLTDDAPTFRNEVAARFVLSVSRSRPGTLAKDVRCPLYVAVCEHDSVAPATATQRHAAKAPRGEVVVYPVGHFDVYVDEAFDKVVADYVDFLHRHVPAA